MVKKSDDVMLKDPLSVADREALYFEHIKLRHHLPYFLYSRRLSENRALNK